ncbi:hypothetical protein F2Q69_00022736 [Brassica cretica]|uniref:Uncharacterized protein n=1 Tax=Brassica cretica TaxID=69181 RepID=A0A8S9PZ68_BRACR|nr:hypothetical protein F2Q69_00022736 [Brassica cretica]
MVVVTQYHNLSYDCLFSAVSDTNIKDDEILRWLRLDKDIQLYLPPVRVMCNSPILRRPTGVIEGALWTRVYSFSQPYVSRYWSRETSA